MHVRYCPECDEEYQPHIVNCADCGALLVDQDDEVPRPPPPPPAEPSLPPGDYGRIFSADRSAELEPLARRLGEAAIPFQVVAAARGGFELRVRSEERDQAMERVKDLLPIPEEETGPDREYTEEGRYRRCPACQTELPAAVPDCPECGLSLFVSEVTCSECGATLGATEPRCPKCDVALE